MLRHFRRLFLFYVFVGSCQALDFKSTAADATILYDGPSTKSNKLFVVGRDYPVEVLVSVEGMVKVRDVSGTLAWVEKKALSDKRTVLVKAASAEVLSAPEDKASLVFRVEQNVLLDVLDSSVSGWVKVKHRDGSSGFIRIQQVWGL